MAGVRYDFTSIYPNFIAICNGLFGRDWAGGRVWRERGKKAAVHRISTTFGVSVSKNPDCLMDQAHQTLHFKREDRDHEKISNRLDLPKAVNFSNTSRFSLRFANWNLPLIDCAASAPCHVSV